MQHVLSVNCVFTKGEKEDIMKKLIGVVLMITMLLSLAACGGSGAVNLSQGNTVSDDYEPGEVPEKGDEVNTDFALKLFKACYDEKEDVLVSPFSVMYALAMTVNGAKNNTLKQMEDVLGMSCDELNAYLKSYMENLPSDENCKLKPANSIWFTANKSFTVNEDFLKRNASCYKADIYEAPFDGSTLKDINNWVKKKTDGMIPEILEDISKDAVMYLVNALAFEAEWGEVYNEDQIHKAEFNNVDGTKTTTDFMYSEEGAYLENEKATGLLKYYKGGKYAFAALLPKEGVTIDELVQSLNGKELHEMLANPEYTEVYAAIPKFEKEYGTELSNVLKGMGMTDAFDGGKADFTGLGISETNNIYISRVIHKTFISVAEKGTKAGAATVVEMAEGAAMFEEEPKVVTLDRPFVYMLVDCENDTPFFIGSLMGMNEG